MKGFLKIDYDTIGEIDFKVIAESMGVIGGDLKIYPAYEKYKKQIQILTDLKGNANSDDFNFTLVLEDQTVVKAEGGVSVTDSVEFGERLMDAAGVDYKYIEILKFKG